MVTADDIAKVHTFDELVSLLRDKLEWPIPNDYGFEDVVYEYEPKELGLKPDETAKIREIHQLRPLVTNQPWGIFFVSFEEKSIPVVVLRRILRALVVKKRADPKTADRAAWGRHDLLFISAFGNGGARELSFAHFADGAETNDLPVLKVLGWNSLDAQLHNAYVASMLAQRLHWPEDTDDVRAWRETWAGAFELGLNQVVRTSKELSVALAALASNIRARANQLLAAEAEDGPMRQLLKAFRENLIEGLTEDDFADMFAQTISYGLLAARISRPAGLVADNLADMIPATNPFLKDLFETFLKLGGRDRRADMDFDELGVRDVVDMLNRANMEAVLRDFGDRNPKEDPVIHFYELFLKEYDPKKRMQRGVFYTPRPVVNFIVRGVDEVLRTEFGLPLGIADTTTWEELAAGNDKVTIPAHVDPKAPFVQILDPATGTGTFLVEAIDLIHARMVEKWTAEGKRDSEMVAAWNEYVPKHLLPRLTGYELMMAPYAIAHMKVGLKLGETGYRFGSNERVRIFLTNALEPPRDFDAELAFMSTALAQEATAANLTKSQSMVTVVIGNPPYSIQSQNLGAAARKWVDVYKYCDGVKIVERNALQFEKNIQDDYVKFFSLAQSQISKSRYGCIGLVTSHGYLDGATFRGMRNSLLSSFQNISILDLHGNTNKRETPPQGVTDENVFEIAQGVCISLMSNSPSEHTHGTISLGDLWGPREANSGGKYDRLLGATAPLDRRVIEPRPPLYLFSDLSASEHFDSWASITEIMPIYSMGIKTSRDELVIDFESGAILDRIRAFRDATRTDDEVCSALNINKKKGWNIARARQDLRSISDLGELVKTLVYRPFDLRPIFYHRSVVFSAAYPVMSNFFRAGNLGLVLTRQTKDQWDVQVVETLTAHKSLAAYDANSVFPLFISHEGEPLHANVTRGFATSFESGSGLKYVDGAGLEIWNGRGDLEQTFGPRDLFDYIYATLHSPLYRTRHADALRSDFPRIALPNSRDLFTSLVPLGTELVAVQLMKPSEAQILRNPAIRFAGHGDVRVARGYPKFENGKVMIHETRWFEDVPREIWECHVGGYQVCEKWLKDRGATGGKTPKPGRVLSDEDILHYRRIVVALTETRRIMAEIDRVIEAHGGWPGAFVVGETASANETAAAD